MAGIDFMSFIEGQRLAEQDNIRDEDRWRKQAVDDSNQAFKEQEQGYLLDDYAAKSDERASLAEVKEVNSFVGQAYDALVARAKARGVEPWRVMLESPDFVLEGASPKKQALFNASWRELTKTNIAPAMRLQGHYDEAGQLEQRVGLAVNQSTKFMEQQKMFKDPTYANEKLVNNGFTPNPDGTWSRDGIPMPRSVAIGIVIQPESGLLTQINQEKQNQLAQQQAQLSEQVATAAGRSRDSADTMAVTKHILSGLPKKALPEHLQYKYDTLSETLKTQASGAPAVSSAPASVDTYTAQPAASAPAAVPTAIRNVAPRAATPIKVTGSPPIESWRPLVQTQGADFTRMLEPAAMPAEKAMTSDINHKSSKELSDLRYAITTGQRIPGLTPVQLAVYLKDINDEIASRHKLEAVRYTRSAKQ